MRPLSAVVHVAGSSSPIRGHAHHIRPGASSGREADGAPRAGGAPHAAWVAGARQRPLPWSDHIHPRTLARCIIFTSTSSASSGSRTGPGHRSVCPCAARPPPPGARRLHRSSATTSPFTTSPRGTSRTQMSLSWSTGEDVAIAADARRPLTSPAVRLQARRQMQPRRAAASRVVGALRRRPHVPRELSQRLKCRRGPRGRCWVTSRHLYIVQSAADQPAGAVRCAPRAQACNVLGLRPDPEAWHPMAKTIGDHGHERANLRSPPAR